jgi:predicted DNA-binding transcriptional regulator AlpA
LSYVNLVAVGVEVVSGAEIGRRLGVSREAVRQWASRAGFPEPLGRVGRSVVWDWRIVEAWSKTNGRGDRLPPVTGGSNEVI